MATLTPTPTLTSTPRPFVYDLTVFFDKNLSGELDYDGEIPLVGVVIEATIDEETYTAVTNVDGIARFEFSPEFDTDTIEIRFPDKIKNPHNDHELTTAIINLGMERIEISSKEKNQSLRFDAYLRNKIDLFGTSLPFMVSVAQIRRIGLSHGEAVYWIPEDDLDQTCVLSHVDLDVNSILVRNYFDRTVARPNWNIGKIPLDWQCDDYGDENNHVGIDTTFLDGEGLVISPYLGIVINSGEGTGSVEILTKLGGISSIQHCTSRFVKKLQPISPGDPICIAGQKGLMPEHVHVVIAQNPVGHVIAKQFHR